jgi:hypothetical protein
MMNNSQKRGGSRWFGYLWHEWRVESRRPIAPAFARPNPAEWSGNRITAAWLRARNGVDQFFRHKDTHRSRSFSADRNPAARSYTRPKRLTAPPLTVRDLPRIDIVLLSHAHFDHFDMHTLHRFDRSTKVITASGTSEICCVGRDSATSVFRVQHWGARKRRDTAWATWISMRTTPARLSVGCLEKLPSCQRKEYSPWQATELAAM